MEVVCEADGAWNPFFISVTYLGFRSLYMARPTKRESGCCFFIKVFREYCLRILSNYYSKLSHTFDCQCYTMYLVCSKMYVNKDKTRGAKYFAREVAKGCQYPRYIYPSIYLSAWNSANHTEGIIVRFGIYNFSYYLSTELHCSSSRSKTWNNLCENLPSFIITILE